MDNKNIIRQELSVEGDSGRLFEVTDSFTGILHSVSDVSGVPIFKIEDTGVSTFSGPVFGLTPTTDLHFATKKYVDDNAAGLTDAPADGSTYGRNNNAWVVAGGSGTVTSVATSGSISGGPITTTGTITHLTTAGNKHMPTGGTVGQVLINTASGTATWQTAPWTSNTGDITGVTAGTGITGGGTSGTVTVNVDLGTGSTQAAFGNHTHSNYITSNATDTATGVYTFSNVTDSTSTTTGAVKITGGLGVAKSAYFGAQIHLLNGNYLHAKDSSGNDTRLIGMSVSNSIYIGHVDNVNAGSVIIRTEGSDRMTITSTGATTFSGNVTAVGFYESSDRRLKENIVSLDNIFKTYNFIGDKRKRYGVIAQEIESTFPDMVKTNGEGVKSVNYNDVLIKELVELKARVKELEDGQGK